MRVLLFLSRVAFLCNLAFLVSVLLQWRLFLSNQAVLSTIVVTGYFLAPLVLSPLVNGWYALQLLQRRPLFTFVPRWLVWVNFAFLLVQLLFVLFFLYDPFHS